MIFIKQIPGPRLLPRPALPRQGPGVHSFSLLGGRCAAAENGCSSEGLAFCSLSDSFPCGPSQRASARGRGSWFQFLAFPHISFVTLDKVLGFCLLGWTLEVMTESTSLTWEEARCSACVCLHARCELLARLLTNPSCQQNDKKPSD